MGVKLIHLDRVLLDKLLPIKNGIIWAWLCANDTPKTIPEIQAHFNLSEYSVKKAIKKILEFKAIEKIGEKYQAKKEHYSFSFTD
jgi:DNA-binding transcriptional regulator GbsR (MarR family)